MVLEDLASIFRCCPGWAVSLGFTSYAHTVESKRRHPQHTLSSTHVPFQLQQAEFTFPA